MKVLLNYASRNYRSSQRRNSETGLSVGGFDSAFSYGPHDIASEFYEKNRRILRQRRGNGYWLWKPYIIKKSLEQLKDGDFLFYCDSGSTFIATIDPLIELSLSLKQDIIPFELEYMESAWTKRDAFKILDLDTPRYHNTRQRLASFMLFRKSRESIDFINEFLELAQDERLITDLENQLGFPNYPGFEAHRHDQSIWSLLTKRNELTAFRDPCQYGNQFLSDRADSPFGQIIDLTRLAQLGKLERYYQEYARDGLARFIREKTENFRRKITGRSTK